MLFWLFNSLACRGIQVQNAQLVENGGTVELRLQVDLADFNTGYGDGQEVTKATLADGITEVDLAEPVFVKIEGAHPHVDVEWQFADPVDNIRQEEEATCPESDDGFPRCPIPTMTGAYQKLDWQSVSRERVDEILNQVKLSPRTMRYQSGPSIEGYSGAVQGYKITPRDLTDTSWAVNDQTWTTNWRAGSNHRTAIVRRYDDAGTCPAGCEPPFEAAGSTDGKCQCDEDCLYEACESSEGVAWAGGRCTYSWSEPASRNRVNYRGTHELEDGPTALEIENKYLTWFIGLEDLALNYKGMLVWGCSTPQCSPCFYGKWRLLWDTDNSNQKNHLECDHLSVKSPGAEPDKKSAWYWKSGWDGSKGLSGLNQGEWTATHDNGVHWDPATDAEFRKVSYKFPLVGVTGYTSLDLTYKLGESGSETTVASPDLKDDVVATLSGKRLVMSDPGLTGAFDPADQWRFNDDSKFHYGCGGVMVDALEWAKQGYSSLGEAIAQDYCSNRPKDYCMENRLEAWDKEEFGYKSLHPAYDALNPADYFSVTQPATVSAYIESSPDDYCLREYSRDGVTTRIKLPLEPVSVTLTNVVKAKGPEVVDLPSEHAVLTFYGDEDLSFQVKLKVQNNGAESVSLYIETTCHNGSPLESSRMTYPPTSTAEYLTLNVPLSCLTHGQWTNPHPHAFRVTDGNTYGVLFETDLPLTVQLVAPVINACTCTGGTPKAGNECSENQAEECADCFPGYTQTANLCVANTCGNQGVTCFEGFTPEPVDTECAICDEDGVECCTENVCTCQNGMEAYGMDCFESGELCESCLDGFHLDADACQANVCTCTHGTAATGSACQPEGEVCASCDAFHHHVGNSCQENECVCAGGTHVLNDSCENDGDTKCVSCNYGHHLENEQCVDPGTHAGFEFLGTGSCATAGGSQPKSWWKSGISEDACAAQATAVFALGFTITDANLCYVFAGGHADVTATGWGGPTNAANTGALTSVTTAPGDKCFRSTTSPPVAAPTASSVGVIDSWQTCTSVDPEGVVVTGATNYFLMHDEVCYHRTAGSFVVDTSTWHAFKVAHATTDANHYPAQHQFTRTSVYEVNQTTGATTNLATEAQLNLVKDHKVMFVSSWSEAKALSGDVVSATAVSTVKLQLKLNLDYNQFQPGTPEAATLQDELRTDLATTSGLPKERLTLTSWEAGSIVADWEITTEAADATSAADAKKRVQVAISSQAGGSTHSSATGAASTLDFADPWHVDGVTQNAVFTLCPEDVFAEIPSGASAVRVTWGAPTAVYRSGGNSALPADTTQTHPKEPALVSGSNFHAGAKLVRFVASDPAQSVFAVPCTFTVTVSQAQVEESTTTTENESKAKTMGVTLKTRIVAGVVLIFVCFLSLGFWKSRKHELFQPVRDGFDNLAEKARNSTRRKPYKNLETSDGVGGLESESEDKPPYGKAMVDLAQEMTVLRPGMASFADGPDLESPVATAKAPQSRLAKKTTGDKKTAGDTNTMGILDDPDDTESADQRQRDSLWSS